MAERRLGIVHLPPDGHHPGRLAVFAAPLGEGDFHERRRPSSRTPALDLALGSLGSLGGGLPASLAFPLLQRARQEIRGAVARRRRHAGRETPRERLRGAGVARRRAARRRVNPNAAKQPKRGECLGARGRIHQLFAPRRVPVSLLIRDGETSQGDVDDARHLVRLGRRHAVAKRGEEDVALLGGEITGVNVVENLQKIPVLLRAAQREVATSARAEMGEGDAPLAVRAVIIESGGQRAKLGFPTAHGIVVAVPWRAAVASELRLERRGYPRARAPVSSSGLREEGVGEGGSGGVITLGTRAGERAGRLGFKGEGDAR